MFKFTDKDKQKIGRIVQRKFTGKQGKAELKEGIALLEKLFNSGLEGLTEKSFERIRAYIYEDKDGNILLPPPAVEAVVKVLWKKEMRGYLRPVQEQQGERVGEGMDLYYLQLGITTKLNVEYAMVGGTGNIWSVKDTYDAEAQGHEWEGDSESSHLLSYLYAWKYRNWMSHPEKYSFEKENPEDETEIDHKELARESIFTMMLDLCYHYKRMKEPQNGGVEPEVDEAYCNHPIEAKYRQFLGELVDGFKERLQDEERQAFFENEYTELQWGERNIVFEKNIRAIMLVGEAGAGKSTKMEQLYRKEIASRGKRLPIWLKMQDLPKYIAEDEYADEEDEYESKDDILVKGIKKCLEEHRDKYEELMEQGMIVLYLDGLNELLDENGDAETDVLAVAIESLLGKYRKLQICMTDRRDGRLNREDFNYVCYKFSSMTPEDFKKYCEKKWGKDEAEKIWNAISPREEKNDWFWGNDGEEGEDRAVVTPEKVNSLREMIKCGQTPQESTEYYGFYLDTILEREQRQKHDNRVPKLKLLLHYVTEELMEGESGNNQFGVDITTYFKNSLGGNVEKAEGYFKLACEMPLLDKFKGMDGKVRYNFVRPEYFTYFSRKDII